MIKNTILIVLSLLSSISIFSQTYITNVSVLDVENHEILNNQTVEITDDLISNIKPSKRLKVSGNATIIDGTGKFLSPGLTDAHIHFFQNGGLYTRPDAIDLRKYQPYHKEIAYSKQNMEHVLHRYLQNGITNVIDVGGTHNLLELRKSFKNNSKTPSIYMTGPLLTTYEPAVYKNMGGDSPFSLVKTIEDGKKMVQSQLPFQPDFIKIWYIVGADGLSIEESARKNLPIIQAIINEAHKNNLKVAVHATQRITAQLAVESGCDFLVHSVDDEIIKDDFVQLLKKSNTILCPTLIVHGKYGHTFGQNLDISSHEFNKADPYQLGSLLDLKHIEDNVLVANYKSGGEQMQSRIEASDAIRKANLKALSDAGVTIATGTDAGNIGTLHASSYLEEVENMSKSGMSNWKIIEASTINGAKVLGKQNQFGSVTIGKKANLILLDKNPVENIANLTHINTVINEGIIFNPKELIKDSPEDLAQRQLNAYNFRDIDAFLEPYDDDVEVYSHPNKLLFKGKEIMRQSYSQMFDNTPNLHCELKNRIVQGNVVIDQERVQFGDRILEAIAIYHIEDGKIKKVYFIQ